MSHRRPRGSITSPPPTSSTSSFPSPSVHNGRIPGADDISHLTLLEVQERLARNSRVLSTGLFAQTPPPTQTSPIPQNGSPVMNGNGNGNGNGRPIPFVQGQHRSSVSAGTSPTDPVRDRLMAVRNQLLERERELLMDKTAEGMTGVQVNGALVLPQQQQQQQQQQQPANGQSNGGNGIRGKAISEDGSDDDEAESSAMAGRRWSGPARPAPSGQGSKASGKRAAMNYIQEREKDYVPNGLILPVSESIALATRDFDHLTASRLSALSINPHAHGLDMGGIPRSSSSPKSRRHKSLAYPDESPLSNPLSKMKGSEDENARAQALARMNAFMSYKSGRYDEDEDDEDDGVGGFDGPDGDGVDGMFDFEELDYPDSSALDGRHLENKRRERGTGEEVDKFGEDDERFAEGNDDDDDDGAGGGMDM